MRAMNRSTAAILGLGLTVALALIWRLKARPAQPVPESDKVEKASEDSFPASDPPAWIASSLS